jgi:cardiolipin synthase (CMP-forming)
MFKKIPNLLTASRIVIIPFILIAMYFEQSVFSHRLAAMLFLYACITDFLDGWLARTYSIQSEFGKIFDPIADKLLVGSVIVVLVYYDKADLFPAVAIICREILVSGLREFLAELRISVPVSKLAKIKTFVQMGAIFLLVLEERESDIYMVGKVALWIAAGLTIFTGYAYLKASYRHLFIRK